MEQILITGLDGSGKSTILNALQKSNSRSDYAIVFLPHASETLVEDDPELLAVVRCISTLSELADARKVPQLKAVALFAAMLIYKDILGLLAKKNVTRVYCERHPLIDTTVYARFYAGRILEHPLPAELKAQIEKEYAKEVSFLCQQIPVAYREEKFSPLEILLQFIHRWFHKEAKTSVEDLAELFHAQMPDKIYFLAAGGKVLFQRIAQRKVMEAHESEEVLNKLALAYSALFAGIEKQFPGRVEQIDAEQTAALESFKNKQIQDFKQ